MYISLYIVDCNNGLYLMGRYYYYGREYKPCCYTAEFMFISVVKEKRIRPNQVSEIKERKIVLIGVHL